MKKILSKPLCFRKLGRSSDMQNDALIHLEGLKGLHIGFQGTVVLSVCPKCLSLTSCQKVAYTMHKNPDFCHHLAYSRPPNVVSE